MSDTSFQKQVAERIKQLRLRRGLVQKDFEKFGYNVRHYQKIESGNQNLTLKTLFKISQALKTDVTEFIRPRGEGEDWFEQFFFECPFGVITWKLVDPQRPESICLHAHNRYGARAVYRDLENSKGKSILEIFPLAREQGVMQMLFEVITTGKQKFVPELIRHDEGFPLTVFSSRFVKCGPDLGAAIFTDITPEFLQRQEILRHTRLPISENSRILELEREVDTLLEELGKPARYRR